MIKFQNGIYSTSTDVGDGGRQAGEDDYKVIWWT